MAAKKVISWVAIAFAAFYLVTNPEDAAGLVRSAGGGIADGFDAIITFLTSVFS